MLPHVLMTLGFAAGATEEPEPSAAAANQGGFLLVGAGCWLALPLFAALLLGVR